MFRDIKIYLYKVLSLKITLPWKPMEKQLYVLCKYLITLSQIKRRLVHLSRRKTQFFHIDKESL